MTILAKDLWNNYIFNQIFFLAFNLSKIYYYYKTYFVNNLCCIIIIFIFLCIIWLFFYFISCCREIEWKTDAKFVAIRVSTNLHESCEVAKRLRSDGASSPTATVKSLSTLLWQVSDSSKKVFLRWSSELFL